MSGEDAIFLPCKKVESFIDSDFQEGSTGSTQSFSQRSYLSDGTAKVKTTPLLVFRRTGRVGDGYPHEGWSMKQALKALGIVGVGFVGISLFVGLLEVAQNGIDYLKNAISLGIARQSQAAQELVRNEQTHAIGFAIESTNEDEGEEFD